MRNFAVLIGAILALSGCASTQKSAMPEQRKVSSEGIHECIVKAGPGCRARIAWACPVGFEDGCNENPSGLHTCVAKKGPDCRAKIMWRCAEGFVNGCSTGQTANHECVPSDTALGGSSCKQEIAKVCPVGFIDRCVANEREHDGPNNND